MGLGPLVRPDLAVASMAMLTAAAALVRPGWRRLLGLGAVAAALPAAYQVFRMGYYGMLVPSTALAKEAGAPAAGTRAGCTRSTWSSRTGCGFRCCCSARRSRSCSAPGRPRGARSCWSEVRVVDTVGLANPLARHAERIPDGRIGHDKVIPAGWYLADEADRAELTATAGLAGTDLADVIAAGRALGCPEVRGMLASVRAPLTWERFRRNLSGAVQRTSLRYPSDPMAAVRCGAG